MDFGVLSGGLGSIKAATELVSMFRDSLKAGTIKPDEIAGRFADLYDYLLNAKDALIQSRDEIQALKTQIDDRQKTDIIESQLEFDGIAYRRNHPDGTKTGPYCPSCWPLDRKLLPLSKLPGDMVDQYKCSSHGSFIYEKTNKPSPFINTRGRSYYKP